MSTHACCAPWQVSSPLHTQPWQAAARSEHSRLAAQALHSDARLTEAGILQYIQYIACAVYIVATRTRYPANCCVCTTYAYAAYTYIHTRTCTRRPKHQHACTAACATVPQHRPPGLPAEPLTQQMIHWGHWQLFLISELASPTSRWRPYFDSLPPPTAFAVCAHDLTQCNSLGALPLGGLPLGALPLHPCSV